MSCITCQNCLLILGFAVSLVLLEALLQSHIQIDPSSSSYSIVNYYEFHYLKQDPVKGYGNPPVFAYWICGTKGEGKKIVRLLKAIYHPRNKYLLQLDACSSKNERRELALLIQSDKVLQGFGNVYVVGKTYALNQMGSSGLAATLHAAALLLKISVDWDWFIALTASDYPLSTQDDLLHAFTYLPREFNLINYTNNTAWKEKQKIKIDQMVVDPSLYLKRNTPVYKVKGTRTRPDTFQVFGGSAQMILTRAFMEYCVQGWDNLPRKLLMYFNNVENPLESYFHTVICNSPEFQNTTIDISLMHEIEDKVPKFEKMIASGAAFARPFKERDPVLDKVDSNVLNLTKHGFVYGNWCFAHGTTNVNVNGTKSKEQEDAYDDDACSNWENGNINSVKPGSYGVKLGSMFSQLADKERFRTNHNCVLL